MSLVKEYFELTQKYHEIYGPNMILLMQVGSFFEVYGKAVSEKKDSKSVKTIQGSQIIEFSRICELNVVEKNICVQENEQVVMAGFKDIVIEKYLKKLQEAGFTAVVYSQQEQGKGFIRSLAGIFSPGTYFSNENSTIDGNHLTNNTTCIWIEYVENKTNILKKGISGTIAGQKNVIVGIANIDIYTGKTSMFQFKEIYANNPTTYDELERFISIYCPSEVIIISNLCENEIDDIIQYTNIQSKAIHKIIIDQNDQYRQSNKKEREREKENNYITIKNCEKQTYQKELICRFYPTMDFDNFVHQFLYDNHLATQAFCYLLDFVYQHNPHLVNKISEPIFENCSHRLILANHSLKQLNIIDDFSNSGSGQGQGKYSSVLKLLNLCITPMGKRKFAYDFLHPTTNMTYLENEYSITEHLLQKKYIVDANLKEIKDISKWTRQILMKKIAPKYFHQLYSNLIIIQEIYNSLKNDKDIMNYLKGHIEDISHINTYCSLICDFLNTNLILDLCKELDDARDFETIFIQVGISSDLDEKSKLLLESIVTD